MRVVREAVNPLFVSVTLVSKEMDTTVQVGFIMSCDLANVSKRPIFSNMKGAKSF